MRKSFGITRTIDDLNAVNNAQKARFQEAVEASGDAEAYVESRQRAYLQRWSEVLPHVERGSSLLDIGAGWPIERIWNTIVREHGINYHQVDIAPDQIAAAKEWMKSYGLPETNAVIAANTELGFENDAFDFVFHRTA